MLENIDWWPTIGIVYLVSAYFINFVTWAYWIGSNHRYMKEMDWTGDEKEFGLVIMSTLFSPITVVIILFFHLMAIFHYLLYKEKVD